MADTGVRHGRRFLRLGVRPLPDGVSLRITWRGSEAGTLMAVLSSPGRRAAGGRPQGRP
jgi:hypothetical protein